MTEEFTTEGEILLNDDDIPFAVIKTSRYAGVGVCLTGNLGEIVRGLTGYPDTETGGF